MTGLASARSDAETPGTRTLSWDVRWPQAGERRVYLRKFTGRPGLIKRVRVLIGGTAVTGPPYLSTVACQGTRHLAGAQKTWLWDGRSVYVSLLLEPGRCSVAGTVTRVRVVIKTVGT